MNTLAGCHKRGNPSAELEGVRWFPFGVILVVDRTLPRTIYVGHAGG